MVHLEEEAQNFKKFIFDSLIGFCCSNSAHTRCMAQYFVKLMFEDNLFKPFIPNGIDQMMKYFVECKNVIKLLRKYGEEVA